MLADIVQRHYMDTFSVMTALRADQPSGLWVLAGHPPQATCIHGLQVNGLPPWNWFVRLACNIREVAVALTVYMVASAGCGADSETSRWARLL